MITTPHDASGGEATDSAYILQRERAGVFIDRGSIQADERIGLRHVLPEYLETIEA
jgi:hypothetical protein